MDCYDSLSCNLYRYEQDFRWCCSGQIDTPACLCDYRIDMCNLCSDAYGQRDFDKKAAGKCVE